MDPWVMGLKLFFCLLVTPLKNLTAGLSTEKMMVGRQLSFWGPASLFRGNLAVKFPGCTGWVCSRCKTCFSLGVAICRRTVLCTHLLTHSILQGSFPALPCRNGDDCHGQVLQYSLQNVSQWLWNCDAHQRGAPIKGTVPNVCHRLTQSTAHQGGAHSKGKAPNVCHRITQSNAHQGGAKLKGTVPNVSHRLTKSNGC